MNAFPGFRSAGNSYRVSTSVNLNPERVSCRDARSTDDQNLDLQRDALTRAGYTHLYEDRISGAKAVRPGLALALEVARSGDQLVVWRLDRLSRSISDLSHIP